MELQPGVPPEAARAFQLEPDIAVVPECENPEEKGNWSAWTDWRWTGDDQHKGLGVFTRDGVTISDTTEIAEADHFLHVETDAVDVLAVWAINDSENPRQRYIGQLHTALETHPELVDGETVVSGDFNWNVMWDESPNSPLCGDFADIQAALNENGLFSAYHAARGDGFGRRRRRHSICIKKRIDLTTSTMCSYPDTESGRRQKPGSADTTTGSTRAITCRYWC